MSVLTALLDTFRNRAQTEREKGTYFEELVRLYLMNEPMYRDLYGEVLTYADWALRERRDGRDVGIDLIGIERSTGSVHAIQCKLYAAAHRVSREDIDSFFTASGQRPFDHRIIVTTTNDWTEHALSALTDQRPPVTKIDLHALETSAIDWSRYLPGQVPNLKAKKALRRHQEDAVSEVRKGLANADRGKLVMACGTGKTFTSLKLAEELVGAGGRVLFLVPSLALLSQTLTEWTQESAVPLRAFAVCSDSDVGKKRGLSEDAVSTIVHELQYPATTDAMRLATEVNARAAVGSRTVVFATYQSIDVVSVAQTAFGLQPFDLILCDEAHRTTGATFEGEDESNFVRVHDNATVQGAKRVYMTATPRIYGNLAKAKAENENVTLCSMDDPELFGDVLYTLSFSEAVRRDLLVDYKVIVLSIEEAHVSRRIQGLLTDENNQLKVDDAARIVGCWKALAKQGLRLADDVASMRRAVAFCQVIERSANARSHKVSSKQIASMFQAVVDSYRAGEVDDDEGADLTCEAWHVDGGMNATEKDERLQWLKDGGDPNTCRILTNVRCLSEGVDVPALDAVMFLSPRNSQVDVVQSVGRVMRKAAGKTRGYVILPVVIPAGVEPHEALEDNQTYRVVWQVLQALRSHDDRFDAMINKLELTGADPRTMEVIAISDKYGRRRSRQGKDTADGRGTYGLAAGTPRRARGRTGSSDEAGKQFHLDYETGEIERAIYAKLVQKVGNRLHWEEWANDVAKIAQTHIDRIQGILENASNDRARHTFDAFAAELRDDINGSLEDAEIVEMLAQHLITKPVFDALFADYSFAASNPMSKAMQAVLDDLHAHHIDKESETLQSFYDSVKLRASGIHSAEARQKVVVELYDKFFRNAFPKMSERLGIVYTPVEIVDFIVRSVDELLRGEFGQTLGSPGVHILDPFTGTGTFITRLLQSELITREQLAHKYRHEIHANEIVLLAYYIAAINVESAYHAIVDGSYEPFQGICLTDTFQMYEKEDLVDQMLDQNSARRVRQKALDIRVILGNPPYSVGQRSQNDNNQNVVYPHLDARIAETYAARSSAVLSKGIYDSYVRAIRWASDRVGTHGIVGFVTNAGFLETNTADGVRRCLAEEFSSLYVFHLRGNQRTSGDRSRREGGKIFGGGSRAPVAISLFVKNPNAPRRGEIYFRDVGDYLDREQKLEAVKAFGSLGGISAIDGWARITPDAHGDWLKQRDGAFSQLLPLAIKDKKDQSLRLFGLLSLGVVTNRDAWAYNPSKSTLHANVARSIDFFNGEVARFSLAHPGGSQQDRESRVNGFVDGDPTKISWTRALKQRLAKNKTVTLDASSVVPSLYRPFSKEWMYFNRDLNEVVSQVPRLFPLDGTVNRVIGVSASESRGGYSVLMADVVPSLHCVDMVGSQFFPLYVYGDAAEEGRGESAASLSPSLFGGTRGTGGQGRRDAITDDGLTWFCAAYPEEQIGKEDVFYYVYGLLHSPDYRERYADNLGKELPRVPRVRSAREFWDFSRAGRELGELHVGFERVDEYPARVEVLASDVSNSSRWRVERMRFGKGKDKTTVHYNDLVTVRDIPIEAYGYVVNGKPAIEWVMERQAVLVDKASGIVKDANDWASETMKDPRYPLSLLLRVINVSMRTVRIVAGLPVLSLLDEG